MVIFSFNQVAFAARHAAGGGDMAKFNAGKFAVGTGIGLASFTVGSALAGGISSGMQGGSFSAGIAATKPLAFSTWATNYSVMTTTGQLGRAVGNMGNYYGWNPKATLAISSALQGVVGGGMNPAAYGTSSVLNGMALGGINGSVQGAVLAATANKRGVVQPWAGAVAGIAGGFASGFVSGALTPTNGNFSFGNKFNAGAGFKAAATSTIQSLPSQAISVGVGYIAQNSKNPQDRYMIQQAFSGVYPMVNAVTNPVSVTNVRQLGPGFINVRATPSAYNYSQFQHANPVGSGLPSNQTLNYNSNSGINNFPTAGSR